MAYGLCHETDVLHRSPWPVVQQVRLDEERGLSFAGQTMPVQLSGKRKDDVRECKLFMNKPSGPASALRRIPSCFILETAAS